MFNGFRVRDNERVLEIDSINGYAVWMFLVPLKCTLKNGQNSKFYVTYILLPSGGSESRLDLLTHFQRIVTRKGKIVTSQWKTTLTKRWRLTSYSYQVQ